MKSNQPAAEFEETSSSYFGWRVVGACFAMALFGWGFGFYGHAVFVAELHRLHGWPVGVIAGASTAFYIAGAVLVAFVSDAIERLGPRRFVLLGIACMAASTMLLPLVSSPWQIYAVYLPMAFGWAALGLGAITNLIGLWFSARRGFAISLALNGASCGGIIVTPALVLLSDLFGFAQAMLIATAAMLVVLLPVVIAWMRRPPVAAAAIGAAAGGFASAGARGTASAAAERWSRTRALRDVGFWTVAGPFALALTAQVGFIVHQIAFLSPLIGRAGAGAAVAITTIMAVLGRVGLGFVIDRLDQRKASAGAFASQAAALAAMMFTENIWLLLTACAVFGFSVGNLITFPALIIQREFNAASFGTLTALVTAIAQFTYALGPGALGIVRDLTGGYAAALAICVALDVVAAALVLTRPARRATRS